MRSDTGSGSITHFRVDVLEVVTTSLIPLLKLPPPLAAPLHVIPALARAKIVSQLLVSSPWNFVTDPLSFSAVHNYMDYSDDSCMNNFTPGQITRLQSQISTYRGIEL